MSSKQKTEYAIEVSNLGKSYQMYDRPSDRLKQMLMRGRKQYFKEFWALKGVTFQIKKGETVGIIGRNGSGKSTLLQMICGTLNPTEGEVKVNGRVAALLELGAGFNPEFTGVENVYMAASLYGLSKEEIDQRFDEIIAFADIGEHLFQPVKTYSSGMYVRLAFAVIAHVDADILVVDEALAVGDAFFTQKCMRFLRNFMKDGTVLFVSHDTASVVNLCDHAIWLNFGQIHGEGSPKSVTEDYLAELYESIQGKSSERSLVEDGLQVDEVSNLRDMRQDFINSTQYRNDLQVFDFNPNSPSFGKKGGEIISVGLYDLMGNPLSWVVGSERVKLSILCKANEEICNPIIGFYLKDKLGQNIFGDNTCKFYSSSLVLIEKGKKAQAIFEFVMPTLPCGDYTLTVALASGSQADHIQHDWIYDAVTIKSHSSSVSTGLIGIPMSKVELKKYE